MTNSSRVTKVRLLAFGVLLLASAPWAQNCPPSAEKSRRLMDSIPDGEYRPQDLAAAFVKNQPILHGPAVTARHFVEITDVEHLDPMVHVLDVPEKLYHKRLRRTGDEISAIAGYHLVLADRTYTLSLGSIVALYLQNLRSLDARAAKTPYGVLE